MEENLRFLKPFIRGSFLIIISIIASVLLAKKYISYMVPMYESTTKMKLADVSDGVQSSNLFKDFDVFASTNKIATEIEVLKSSVLLNKTLDSLDFDVEIYRVGKIKSVELYNDSPFSIKGNLINEKAHDKRYILKVISPTQFTIYENYSNEILAKGIFGENTTFQQGEIKITLDHNYIDSKPNLNLIDTYEFEFLSRQKLISRIATNLDINSVDKDVAVVRISYESAVPDKAAILVNTLAKTYIRDYIEAKYLAAETTEEFLDDQIKEVSKKLSNSESKIQGYRNAENITNIRQETETDLRKISQLKIQQTNVKMNLLAIQSLNNYIQSGKENFLELAPNFEAFTDLLSTEIIKNIKALQAEKKDLLLIFTPEEERVTVIDAKIRDLTDYLIESISNTTNNLKIKYDNLSAAINEFEKAFITIPEKEKIITLMKREFEIHQKTYISLNEKRIEAKIAKAAKISFHRIISPAKPSKQPTSPNRPIIIIVSALMGLFGSLLLIYLMHLTKAKVNGRHTVESKSGIPIATVTPKLKNTQEIKNHFLQKAGQLEIKKLVNDKDIVCISSFKSDEGSVFNAVHLADALSQQSRKVLLIDIAGNLHNPTENKEIRNHKTNLDIIELTNPIFQSYTKIKLEQYIENIKQAYDVILILNEEIYSQNSLLMMSLANVNLVAIDSRLTPSKKIIEVDLIKEEYDISSIQYILNRYEYNPSILKECYNSTKRIFQKRKNILLSISDSKLNEKKQYGSND